MEVKMLPHGYIILPDEICRRLGLETGARLDMEFDEKTGRIYLRPILSSAEYSLERGKKEIIKSKPAKRKNDANE